MNMMNPTWLSYWQILSRPPPTEFFILLYQKTAPHRNPPTDFFKKNFFTLLSSLFTQDSLPVATQQGCCMSIMNNRKSLVCFLYVHYNTYQYILINSVSYPKFNCCLANIIRPVSDLLLVCSTLFQPTLA